MNNLNVSAKEDETARTSADVDEAYRNYIADLVMEYATERGVLNNNPEAYRRVMAVTGRTLGTVKNWLAYRTNAPDLASLARIVEHWKIPPQAVYPQQLPMLLGTVDDSVATLQTENIAGNLGEHVLISFHGRTDAETIDKALSKYTDQPRSALLVRQVGSDMIDEIRPGELMLVDSAQESINGSGIYVLRISSKGSNDTVCVRFVERLLGEPNVRLRGGSASPAASVETLPLIEGVIPGVTVLARVLGVLRQL
jgi:hypothetical protein